MARKTFTPAAVTAPTAEPPVPVPAEPPVPAPRMSDIPSKEPRNNGHDDFSLDALIADRPDPDLDLVTRSYAVPRYLVEALRLYHVRSRRPQQAIVADALRDILPANLVEACRRKAEGG